MGGQHKLETILSNEVCTLYRSVTGHSAILTDCRFLSDDKLALVFEEPMTPIEQLFVNQGLFGLSKSIRDHVDHIFDHKLTDLVKKITKRPVIDLLSKSKVETNRKGMILVLAPHSNQGDEQGFVSLTLD